MTNNNYTEFYVSVDVEATGPIPGPYSMTALGAFIAGARTKDNQLISFSHHDESKVFYSELKPLVNSAYLVDAIMVGGIRGYEDDESLSKDEQAKVRFEHLQKNAPEVIAALEAFIKFVIDFQKETGGRPVFVAFPLSFDWTFVYWYMVSQGLESPFGFSSAYDLKSAYASLANKGLTRAGKRFMPKSISQAGARAGVPHSHFADDDAIEQGYMGMEILKALAEKS